MAEVETTQNSPTPLKASEHQDSPKLVEDVDEEPMTVEEEISSKHNGTEALNGKVADKNAEPMEVDDDDDNDNLSEKEKAENDAPKTNGEPEEKDESDGEKEVEKEEAVKANESVKESCESNGKSPKPSNGDVIGIDSDSDDEPMEVDGKVNGVVDDDKPVSIGSDSDSESDITSQSNSNAPTQDNSDVQEILSDKEDDCVVIDDKEDKPSKEEGEVDPLGIDKTSSTSCSPVSFKIANPEKREPPSLTVVDTSKLMKTVPPTATKTSPHKQLLPALTDDMFVLEAPSFIVPYIYEKPPSTQLKETVNTISKELKEKLDKVQEEDEKKRLVDKDEQDKVYKLLDEEAEKEKRRNKKRQKQRNDDEEWDEAATSDEDSDEEGEGVTKVLIKEIEDNLSAVKEHIITPETIKEQMIGTTGKKSDSFFESPLGKFFMEIGVNLVQEAVQTDLLRQQKRKRDKEGGEPSASTQMAINSLMKNLETSKENNAPFKYELKRCEYCNFKSESALAMAHHYETPHTRLNIHKCNFCQYESKNAHEILYHMEALHNIKGRLEKAACYHQCPNCMFEDNGRSKLARHALACAKKFKPEANLVPPLDWDPPAKIPKIKPKHGLVGTATAYQLAAQQQQQQLAAQQQKAAAAAAAAQQRNAALAAAMRNRGIRATPTQKVPQLRGLSSNVTATLAGRSFNLNMSGGNLFQSSGNRKSTTPSISITPVPRQSSSNANSSAFNPLSAAATTKIPPGVSPGMKPGQNPNATGKTSFVICEICDGYIKDLDQLRNHMQWIHKVKIHPKMIYNRPPLNCQKCQYRFFTDQGLERHLLGSHGLVTSSMQEAANKGKDAGRCPVCGRVYQWKLLNHVSRDHNMTLKPAHLSYKCTVCTATFGMYKQFESHVYSAHSTVAKKTGGESGSGGGSSSTGIARKSSGGGPSSSSQSLLKPLKINDEITIIPQPSKPMISNTKPIEIE